jgi:hypothetical protein
MCLPLKTKIQAIIDNPRYVNGSILGESFKFLVDTGTTVNILDEISYTSIKHKINKLQIVSCNILAYNKTPIETLGEFEAISTSTTKQ